MNWKWSLLATLTMFGCPEAGGGLTIFEGGELKGTVTWSGTVEVRSSFTLSGALTIAKCTTVLLPPDGQITVADNGALKAEGTADCPVTLKSVKSSPAAGDWNRIEIQRTASNDSKLTHTRVLHGNGELYGVIWVDDGASLGLDAVTFERSKDVSLQLEEGARLTTFRDVRFVDSGEQLVRTAASLVSALTPITTSGVARPRVVVRGDLAAAASWRNLGVALQLPSMAFRGGALEVEAGAVLQLEPGAVITVAEGGALRLLGTAAAPVALESSKSSPAPGDWQRIDVLATAQANNLFRHVTVRHGGDAFYGVLWLDDAATFTLENSTFSQNSSCDISAGGTLNDSGSTFVRCQ